MFFSSTKNKINSSWNINDFVVGSGNRSRRSSGTSGADAEDNYELNNTIKKIEQAFSSGKMELEAILREMKNKRKEIRARFQALENDPENEATFHKMDVDLLLSQVKITESKVKFAADKFKQIRDEKKLNIDKSPKVPETQINVHQQQNNPLYNEMPGGAQHQPIIQVGTLDPSAIISGKSRYDEATPAVEVKDNSIPIPCNSGANGGSVAPTPIVNEPVLAVSRSWDGEVITDSTTINDARQSTVAHRLRNQDQAFEEMKSVQGIDYKRSINALVNNTKTLTKKMFINTEDGTYYIRTYENVDGVAKPCTTEIFDSILHIGVPEFNGRNKTVKPQYEDEYIPYELIDGAPDMPEYYKDSWRDPSVRRFILNDETLETL
ncbi:MAG: hypothetical protein ACRCX8_12635 [Sarcina sp.]